MKDELAANVLLDTNDRMNDCRKGTILANFLQQLLWIEHKEVWELV